jgi:hypothetical protein
MFWLSVAAAVVIAFLIAVYAQRQKQKATVAAFRARFPHIARLRLVAACPGLDGVLQETELRMLFDWIMLQLHGRTRTSSYGDLMQWTTEHGEAESLRLVAEVTRDAVDRLPSPVLAVIDDCQGRTVAGVILDQSLSESGRTSRPSAPAQ